MDHLPLYLFGRSLLVDDPALYDLATRLYRTRNVISHEGGAVGKPPPPGLSIDADGAKLAIKAANAIFGWFGEAP